MTRKNKPVQRILSWLLVFLMVMGWNPVLYAAGETAEPAPQTEAAEAAESSEPTEPTEPTEPVGLTMAELMRKFPDGKYWNGGDPDSWTETPCNHHGHCGDYGWNGWCGCNSFNGQSIQCMGFAEKLGYDATGYNPRVNENGWKTKSYSSALNSLKAGDIVRRNGHSMYVIGVDGETVTIADCNSKNKSCNIRWGATVTKSNLRNNFEYVRSAPKELVIGYLGKCEDYPSSGTFVLHTDAVLKTDPCTSEIYEGSLDVASVCAGTELTATGICKNTEGQYWYEVIWEEQVCYVPADATGVFSPDFGTVTAADISAPANTRKGKGFPIKGTIRSDVLPLTMVGAYIFAGNAVGDTPYLTSEAATSNQFTYSIYCSTVDSNLTFGTLPLGEYTYLLTAAVTNSYIYEGELFADRLVIRLHQNTFTVSSSLPCTHAYQQEETTAATCGDDGALTFTCTKCAFTYTQTVFATDDHTLGQWETVQKATCTEEGYAILGCTGCDLAYIKTLPATDYHPNETPVYHAPTCTEMGYVMLYCADCGITLGTEDHEAAYGHAYGEWVVTKPATLSCPGQQQQSCIRCGDVAIEEIPCLAGTVEGWNLTLSGELNVNFQLRIDENIRDTARVVITVNEETFSYQVNAVQRDQANDTYRFTVPVTAAQMADTIRVQVINGEDISQTAEYSVLQYAQTVLSDESLSDCHALIREMLAYGAAAQVYFDHNTENLANIGISGTSAQEVPAAWEQAVTVDGSAEGIRFYGASLVYRNKIAVRYYFTVSDISEQYVFRCGNGVYTPVSKDGLWYIEIPDICIQDLDDLITLTANDSLSITYSPMNYLVRMHQKGTENAKNLLKAMYNYHLAAEAYLESE